MIYLLIFILGLLFGSFSSVIIHRLHTEERGIFWGRSHCPRCKTKLRTLDLIPVVSFLINQFKCHFCKNPIALRYPLLELTMGAGFLVTFIMTADRPWFWIGFYLLITFGFVLLSFYDLLFQEVPDKVAIPMIGFAGLVILLSKTYAPDVFFIGVAIPVLFFGFLFLVSRGRWLGGGDIRIGAIMGILLAWPQVLVGLFLSYLLGAIYSVIGILFKKLTRKSHIPFAPFLLLGTYITFFWGDRILAWYLSFS